MSLAEQLFKPNLLNEDWGSGVLWTRVNVGEATPGTVTPLTADFQRPANHRPPGRMFHRMGLVRKPEVLRTRGAYIVSFLCGKLATNVDVLRWLMDRTPGTSGDEFEQSILGSVRPDVASQIDRRRYPIALIKLLWLIVVLPSENRRLGQRTQAWWAQRIEQLREADINRAIEIFRESRREYETVIDHAGLVAAFSPALLSQLSRPINKIGTEEDLLTVSAGYGNVKETDMLQKLWQVAKGEYPLANFLNEYGYMCPSGAELASKSWREEPESLSPIIAANRAASEDNSPHHRLQKTKRRVAAKRQELFEKSGFFQQLDLKFGLWITNRMLPIREVGKACMFMAPDVGRAAARVIGSQLVQRGRLDDPEDVFYLSCNEVTGAATEAGDLRKWVKERKKLREIYAEIELPDFFTSDQLSQIVQAHITQGTRDNDAEYDCEIADLPRTIEGVAASAGQVTGIARVIHDPRDLGDFKPGEVLVCHLTDPGWAALFSIAGAMVVDIGGMLSHSAIIAREMGIPTVINTRNGTKLIPDGAKITVDGSRGIVTLHKSEEETEKPHVYGE